MNNKVEQKKYAASICIIYMHVCACTLQISYQKILHITEKMFLKKIQQKAISNWRMLTVLCSKTS